MLKTNKNKDAIPVPEIEVYARATGKIQYTCPLCHQEHPFRLIHWRRGDLFCFRCVTKYQFGLGFTREPGSNGYLMGKWNSYTVNRLNPTGTPYEGARLYGTVEFACPHCHFAQRGFVKHDGLLECESCSIGWYISVLLYRLPKVSRLKVRAPFDSIVKGLHASAKTIQPLSAATADSSRGTPSGSTRKDS